MHGNSGVCRVESIQNMDGIGGAPQRTYYTLVPIYTSGSKLFVPTDGKRVVTRPVMAKKEAENFPQISVPEQPAEKPTYDRVPRPDKAFRGNDRIKMKTMGKESVMINRDTIDLRYLEQIADSEQVTALGYCVRYAQKHLIDGKKNLIQIVDELEEVMQNKSLAALCESTSSVSCMAVPRRQEIFACFDRYRALRLV